MPTYRQLHEEKALRENRPAMYRELKQRGELKAHLDEIAESATDMPTTAHTHVLNRSGRGVDRPADVSGATAARKLAWLGSRA